MAAQLVEHGDRAALAEALGNLVHSARRTFRKVGTPELPTPYDLLHGRIDELLTLMDLCE